jgi:hypothetical protein
MRLGRQMFLTSEFSAAFRLTKKWHLLAQTGHAAVNGQYSGVAIYCERAAGFCPDRSAGSPSSQMSHSLSSGCTSG